MKNLLLTALLCLSLPAAAQQVTTYHAIGREYSVTISDGYLMIQGHRMDEFASQQLLGVAIEPSEIEDFRSNLRLASRNFVRMRDRCEREGTVEKSVVVTALSGWTTCHAFWEGSDGLKYADLRRGLNWIFTLTRLDNGQPHYTLCAYVNDLTHWGDTHITHPGVLLIFESEEVLSGLLEDISESKLQGL